MDRHRLTLTNSAHESTNCWTSSEPTPLMSSPAYVSADSFSSSGAILTRLVESDDVTRGEQTIQTLSHSTPMTIGLVGTILGVVFFAGVLWTKVSTQETQVSSNTAALAAVKEAIVQLTEISRQQSSLLEELRRQR